MENERKRKSEKNRRFNQFEFLSVISLYWFEMLNQHYDVKRPPDAHIRKMCVCQKCQRMKNEPI